MKDKTLTSLTLAAAIGISTVASGAIIYSIGTTRDIVEMGQEQRSSPTMEKARAVTQTRKVLEGCVIPESTYNTPAVQWDRKTKECLRDAKEYEFLLGGDLSGLRNANALSELVKSNNEYWTLFPRVDPFGTEKSGFEPYSTRQHMDAAIEIMKRRDWLTNREVTRRVTDIIEDSYNKYAECAQEDILGKPREEKCPAAAKSVRSNYVRFNKALAQAGEGTYAPLDMLERLEGN